MNTKILYFVGGVVAGSVATFFITKHICDKEKEEEIAEVKKTYSDRPLLKVIKKEESDIGVKFETEPISPKELANLNNKRKEDILANRDIINKQNYNLFYNPPKGKDIHNGVDENEDLNVFTDEYEEDVESTPPKEGAAEKPYTISPTQFVNEEPYFDKISLEYFNDGILANALSEEIIENVEYFIGADALDKFGEYEEDVVYVRNERISTDYEIIRQDRPFARFDEDEEDEN